MPDLERPPTYATTDPRAELVPNRTLNINEASSSGSRTLEFHKDFAASTGIHIKQNDNTLYYVGHYQEKDEKASDIVLYGGYDSKGPWLAQSSFPQLSNDFKIYVGEQKTPSNDDWDTVRCAGGGVLSAPSYRFESRTGSNKTRLYWKKTHDSKLGASKLSPRDYKLVDEISDEVVAVYVEKSFGSGAVKGSISFRREIDVRAEISSLMVLLSLLERSKRYMQHVARTFPSTNSY